MRSLGRLLNQSNRLLPLSFYRQHSNYAAGRLEGLRGSVWLEFSQLAAKYNPVNLGQGFPDFDPPKFLLESLNKAANDPSVHQYPLSRGHTPLLESIAKFYSLIFHKILDPNKNVLVSNGAYGCLFSLAQALVNKGDEVIIIEPFYDCYINQALLAGGTLKYVPLRATKENPKVSQDWALDPDELSAAFSNKTKMVVINNPNNPLGKVYSESELKVVADLCQKFDAICVSDEVYEFNVFDGLTQERMASLDGMWDRTLTIHSAGKIFSVTGWKVGWTIGPQHLIDAVSVIHANSLYCTVRPTQMALAEGLNRERQLVHTGEPSYLEELRQYLQDRRDQLANGLREVGIIPIIPSGTYFMLANTETLGAHFTPSDYGPGTMDYKLARWLYKDVGVGAIPPTAFYSEGHSNLGERFLRFSFSRTPESIEKAIQALKKIGQ